MVAPLSPQFYCAYRSIQATRISPGARLEILLAAAPSPPPQPPSYHFPTSSPTPPPPLGRCFFFFFLRLFLVLSPDFVCLLHAVEFNPPTSIAIIFFLPRLRLVLLTQNRTFDARERPRWSAFAPRPRRDDTRVKSRGRSRRSQVVNVSRRSSRPFELLRTSTDFRRGETRELCGIKNSGSEDIR